MINDITLMQPWIGCCCCFASIGAHSPLSSVACSTHSRGARRASSVFKCRTWSLAAELCGGGAFVRSLGGWGVVLKCWPGGRPSVNEEGGGVGRQVWQQRHGVADALQGAAQLFWRQNRVLGALLGQ